MPQAPRNGHESALKNPRLSQRNQTVDVSQEGVDLARVESEMRHCRMAGHYAFSERLGQCFDGVALRQITERWGQAHRTAATQPDGMTPRALLFGYGPAAFGWRALADHCFSRQGLGNH